MCNVVFWDIKGLHVTEDELKEAVLETGAIRWVHWKSAGWIEVAYSTNEDRDQAVGQQILLPHNHVGQPVLPRKYSAQQIYIRLANVLILLEKQLREGITEYWETFGIVRELEPHYYVETSALSRRWDMILVVAAGRKLDVSVIYNFHSSRVCCYWKGATACCMTYKTISHFADDCNSRFRALAEKRDAEV